MAMIQCPECGNRISSQATSCVHCGCKIHVCPDCGMVNAGEKEFCESCGCVFVKKTERAASAPQSAVSNSGLCEGLVRKYKKTVKIYTVIKVLILLIGMAMLIYAGISVTLLNNFNGLSYGEILDKMLNLDGETNKIKALFSVGAVLIASGFIANCPIDWFLARSFAKQLHGHKDEYTAFCCSALDAPANRCIIQAIAYLEVPEKGRTIKTMENCRCIFLVLFAIALILLDVWICGVVEEFKHALYLDMNAEINLDFSTPLFVAAVVLYVIELIVDTVLHISILKKKIKRDELVASLKN